MSESVLEGRLTAVEYRQWFFHNLDHSRVADLSVEFPEVSERRMQREFDLICQSELIVENFSNLDEVFKQCVEWFAAEECSLSSIEAFVSLALEMQSFEISLGFDLGASPGQVSLMLRRFLCRDLSELDAKAFSSLVYQYVMTHKDSDSQALVQIVVMLLTVTEGASRVTEVLRRWLEVYPSGMVSDFVDVVRDWENLRMYPIEWAVNIIRSSRDDD